VKDQPDLLILDEPFFGLDPVNVELLKGLFAILPKKGEPFFLTAIAVVSIEIMRSIRVAMNQ
jgi:ABC-2 type transport system ATP-binding protein